VNFDATSARYSRAADDDRAGREGRAGERAGVERPGLRRAGRRDRLSHRGSLDFVDNQVDPSTGTIHVRAVLPNPDRLLTPGVFVRVRLPMGEAKPGLLVNDRAIGTDQDRKYLLVVNDKNVVEYRPVKLGPRQGPLRAISDGIGAGEWVIVNGIQRVRPGVTVTPQKVSMQPEPAKTGS
jgi:RND family efflux transporter MFP subunit